MSGKKYRPALFELMNKGTLKPREDGSLPAPEWLNGSKKKSFSLNFLRKKPRIDKKPTLKIPTTPVSPNTAPSAGPVVKPPSQPVVPVHSQKWKLEDNSTTGVKSTISGSFDRRIDLSVSYGILALAMLVLILMLLAMFWLGQISVANNSGGAVTPSAATASGDEKLADLRNSPARPDSMDVGSPREVSHNQPIPDANPSQPKPSPAPAAATAVPDAGEIPAAVPQGPQSGMSLIICTHDNLREIRQLQSYFNKNGVQVEIGRFGGKYVLHSVQTFDKVSDANSSKLKRSVSELGANYNAHRESGAAIFSPSTFAESSTYFVKIDRIQ